MLRVGVSLTVFVLLVGVGCQSAPLETTGTAVQPGETLYGRLPVDRKVQAFSFEGVEGSLLDFDVLADGGNISAPDVELIDPDGDRVDISAATESPDGAASMEVRGVVLLSNGIYKLNVRPAVPSHGTWYRFRHELRFPAIASNRVRLTAEKPHPVYVSAPRRGLVAFRMKPDARTGVVPEIRGVTDPWGGRALAKSQVPKGAHPPRLSRTFDGEQVLTFTAPRPGRYTILAAAKRGTEGVVDLSAEVRPPAGADRMVYHPNTPPHYGVPGNRHGAPQPADSASGAPPSAPPPPPPPVGPVRRVTPPPATPLLPDPSLAQR